MYLWTATGSPQTNDSERGITMKKIGAITVGQSPRVDLIPEIQPILGDSVEIIQAGALDGLSKEEIAKFVPRPGEKCPCVETYRRNLSDIRRILHSSPPAALH